VSVDIALVYFAENKHFKAIGPNLVKKTSNGSLFLYLLSRLLLFIG
jgi:hypothetical protein